jgi:hypothetical protein
VGNPIRWFMTARIRARQIKAMIGADPLWRHPTEVGLNAHSRSGTLPGTIHNPEEEGEAPMKNTLSLASLATCLLLSAG